MCDRDGRLPNESFRDMLARKRIEYRDLEADLEAMKRELNKPVVVDPYENSYDAGALVRKKTGFAYNASLLEHKCEWDEGYPENPFRVSVPYDRLKDEGLVDRCQIISNDERSDIKKRILKVHSLDHLETLGKICEQKDVKDLEQEASGYDAVYFNQATSDCAHRSLALFLNLIDAVASGEVQNGFALIRPPGHHAMQDGYCGYCFFNNVAIGANMIINKKLGKKVLIIDYDVHHGQGTQQLFYNRQDVMYISIHRYEQGTFWPNLQESNFHYIGTGPGLGYNVNIPLNATGLADKDYLAILFNIILPISYEFNPDFILISGGYDACMGCPEGQMNVTPGFYSHFITLISGLAKAKVIVALEGGYFIPSLTEGIVQTVKALLGDPCPPLDPIDAPHPEVIESISSVKRMLMPFWKCFSFCDQSLPNDKSVEHRFQVMFLGEPPAAPYETRDCYPVNPDEHSLIVERELENLQMGYTRTELPVCFVHEDAMLKHKPASGSEPPEKPQRITAIIDRLKNFELYDRMIRVRVEQPRADVLFFLKHDPQYIVKIQNADVIETPDLFMNRNSPRVSLLAVSALLTLTDSIFKSECNIAIGVVRPPGHHAEFSTALGYCLYNNVASAATYAMQTYKVTKILIVDFDIHHGNGIQNAFYESKNVLYISVHRYDGGKFFPQQRHSNYTDDGHGLGKGYNVNIPFSGGKMGNTEYLAVFTNIILPIAYSFAPDFVIIAAGFDAGANDPLGGYTLNPETFGHFIQMLKPLAGGRMLIALEGGYNLTTLSYGMAFCAKVALGDPIPTPKDFSKVNPRAVDTMKWVINHFKYYWPALTAYRKLSNRPIAVKMIENFSAGDYIRGIDAPLAIERIHDNAYVDKVVNF